MKKLITTILLLLTFISGAQSTDKVEVKPIEKFEVKPAEEVISLPILICSNEERTRWFAISPVVHKSNGILIKTYLKTLKLDIGKCSKNDVLVFTFKDGKKIRISANNEINCEGIVEIDFPLNSIDVAFLETKPLNNIRYINGNDSISFIYFSKPDDSNYFINIFENFKK